jgi:hypothetical protein
MTLVDELFDQMIDARNRLISAMLDGEESEFLLNHLVEAFEQRNTLCLIASHDEPDFNRYAEVVSEIWYCLDERRDMSYEEIVLAFKSLANKCSVFRNMVSSLKAELSHERTPTLEDLIRQI